MRVLMTHTIIGRGGDAVQWAALAEGFRRLGHRVTSAGLGPLHPYAADGALPLRGLARRVPWQVRDAVEVGLTGVAIARAWWAARRGVDLVVHRAAPYDMMGAVMPGLLRVPVVVYLDAHLAAERRFRGESHWRVLHEAAMRRLARAAVALVTPSEAVRTYYSEMGLPPDRLMLCPNGVFASHLDLGAEAVRTSPPLAQAGRCVLGFVGSLADWHRVDALLVALGLLAGRRDGVTYRLIVVGSGREASRLRAMARGLDVASLVDWRGPCHHEAAVSAMAGFDVAVLPSTLPTGSPMKLIEYAAMGRPIIAPALPNIEALLTADAEALLVAPGDPQALAAAVTRLIGDPAAARRMGRAAQDRVRGWTWEATAERLVAAAAVGGRAPLARAGTAQIGSSISRDAGARTSAPDGP